MLPIRFYHIYIFCLSKIRLQIAEGFLKNLYFAKDSEYRHQADEESENCTDDADDQANNRHGIKITEVPTGHNRKNDCQNAEQAG